MGRTNDEYTDAEFETIICIGESVYEHAADIFVHAGCPDDFCIQSVGSSVVFGGLNRLLWHPVRGFSANRAYCTFNFLDKAQDYGVLING